MKQSFIIGLMLLSTIISTAQNEKNDDNPTSKGHFIIDGTTTFSYSSSKSYNSGWQSTNNSYRLGFSPKAAYFVIDKLALGAQTSVNYYNNSFSSSSFNSLSSTNINLSVGPVIRYYLSNRFFSQASAGFGTSKSNNINNTKNTSNSINYKIGLGYSYFLNQSVSIDPIIEYQYYKYLNNSNNTEITNNGIAFGAGFTIYI